MARRPASSSSLLRRLFRWGSRTRGPGDMGMGGAMGQPGKPNRTQVGSADYYNSHLKTPAERNKQYDLYDELDDLVPEIATVLDAMAEDSCQFDPEHKASVWVEGKNKEVVNELNMLFRRLEIEEWIEGAHRDLAKQGDDFGRLMFFDPDKDPERAKLGVLGIEWFDPRYIERVEDENGVLLGFLDTNKMGATALQQKDVFMPWDFVHFRLRTRKYATNTGANVYGTSLIKNAARPGKQLHMVDSMLQVMRLTKSTDKRVYEIDVGDASPQEIPGILRSWQQIFTRSSWRDLISGESSQLYDPLAFDEDIFWPKRKGSDTKVDVIPAEPNIRDLEDVKMKRNQLFGAMRAPQTYFGFGDEVDAERSASSRDVRFARVVKKLQRGGINGLTRLCQIHLALKGMSTDLSNFQVKFQEPSAIEHVHRLEATQVLIDIAERMVAMGESMNLNPVRWRMRILRQVFGFSELDIRTYFQRDLAQHAGMNPDDAEKQDPASFAAAMDQFNTGPMGMAPDKEKEKLLNSAMTNAAMEKALGEREIYIPDDPYLRDPLPNPARERNLLPPAFRVAGKLFERDAEDPTGDYVTLLEADLDEGPQPENEDLSDEALTGAFDDDEEG